MTGRPGQGGRAQAQMAIETARVALVTGGRRHRHPIVRRLLRGGCAVAVNFKTMQEPLRRWFTSFGST